MPRVVGAPLLDRFKPRGGAPSRRISVAAALLAFSLQQPLASAVRLPSAQDAIDLAAQLGLDRFAVVGHDWGARTAYTLAALFPQRVTRIAPPCSYFLRLPKSRALDCHRLWHVLLRRRCLVAILTGCALLSSRAGVLPRVVLSLGRGVGRGRSRERRSCLRAQMLPEVANGEEAFPGIAGR
jgi:pimeloyl-ACP methyl ester carboxylesterase